MPWNPFVRLAADPVATLSIIAYALLLLGATLGLAGTAYRTAIRLYLEYENRRDSGNYAPAWEYIPPWRVIGMVVAVAVLAAVEMALLAGIVYVFT